MSKKSKRKSNNSIEGETRGISKPVVFVLLAIISFLFYGSTLKNGYSMDDELVTTTDSTRGGHENVEKGIGGLKDIFTSHYTTNGKQSYGYRPITTYSFAVEWTLFHKVENRAKVSHFISILLYIIVCYLLYLYLLTLFKGKGEYLALFTVLIFLIHPIHSEVVNNIKSRDELLSLMFALLSALHFFKYYDLKKNVYFYTGVLFLLLGVLSKINALAFAVIIPLSLYFFRDMSIKSLWRFGLVFIGVFALFIIVRKTFINEETVRSLQFFENPLVGTSIFQRIPMFFYTVVLYIGKLLMPYPLKYYYGYAEIEIVGYNDLGFFVGLIVVLSLLYFAYRGLKTRDPLSFAILFFFFAIGGACNLLMPAVGIFAERFAFFGSIGFVMAISILLFKWQKVPLELNFDRKKSWFSVKALNIVLLIVFIPSFVYSINRNSVWKSKMSLYKHDIEYLHNSAKAHSLIASEMLYDARQMMQRSYSNEYPYMMAKADSVKRFLLRAVEIDSTYKSCLNNLSVTYNSFYYDYDSAMIYADRAYRLDSNYLEAIHNLANASSKKARLYRTLENYVSNGGSKEMSLVEIEESNLKMIKTLYVLFNLRDIGNNLFRNGLNSGVVNKFRAIFGNNINRVGGVLAEVGSINIMNQVLNNLGNYKGRSPVDVATEAILLQIKKKGDKLFAVSKEQLNELANKYYTESVTSFDNCIALQKNYGPAYQELLKLAMDFQDFERIIQTNRLIIENLELNYNHRQYIQIANSYNSLNQMDSANFYFEKVIGDLYKESNDLSNSSNMNKSERINKINTEVRNIYNYLIEINLNKGDTLTSIYYRDILQGL